MKNRRGGGGAYFASPGKIGLNNIDSSGNIRIKENNGWQKMKLNPI